MESVVAVVCSGTGSGLSVRGGDIRGLGQGKRSEDAPLQGQPTSHTGVCVGFFFFFVFLNQYTAEKECVCDNYGK